MIAVLASPDLYRQRPVLNAHSELAGINSPDHFILSALAEDLPIIEADLAQAEIAFQRLPVPFAFHSRFVEGAQQAWNEAFGQLRRESAYWPVWSSATCATVGPASGDLHWSVVRRQMNVLKTLEALEARGGGIYVDLSPSSTLAAIFRQALGNHSPSRLVPILSPFGNNIERLNQAVKILQNDKPLPTRSPVSIQ